MEISNNVDLRDEKNKLLEVIKKDTHWSCKSVLRDDIIRELTNMESIDPNMFLALLRKVIRTEQINDVVAEAALKSISKLLSNGLIGQPPETMADTVEKIAGAIIYFLQTIHSSSAYIAAIAVVHCLIKSSLSSVLSNGSVYQMIIKCLNVCADSRENELQQGYPVFVLKDIVSSLFSGLPEFYDRSANVHKKKKANEMTRSRLPCMQKLFIYLIHLCNKFPNNKEGTIKVQMGLSLLTAALKVGSGNIKKFYAFHEIVQHQLCRKLIELMDSKCKAVFFCVMEASFFLFISLRDQLKLQLEVHLKKLLDIIACDNPKTSNEVRELALINLVNFFRSQGFIADLYINYDCDLYCSNLFQDIIKKLSKYTLSATSIIHGTHLYSVDTLISVIDIIYRNCMAANANVPSPQSQSTRYRRQTLKIDDIAVKSQFSNKSGAKRFLLVAEKIPKFINDFTSIRTHLLSQQISHEKLIDLKNKKSVFIQGTKFFNQLPEKGIKYLQENGIFNTALDPEEVVYFLRENPGLDEKMICEYISKNDNVQRNILHNFVKSFDFSGLKIDKALRLYLETFQLPDETSFISLVLEYFADHWHKQNNEPFANKNAAVSLTHAIIMLNKNLHNFNEKMPGVQITSDDFFKRLHGLNGEVEFDQELLIGIFNSIKDKEIAVAGKQTRFTRKKHFWIALLRRGIGVDGVFNHVQNSVYDKELFHIISGDLLSVLTVMFNKSDDNVSQRISEDFRKYAAIATHYKIYKDLDAVIHTLCKLTTVLLVEQDTPNNITENFGLNRKAQTTIQAVFTLLQDYGNCINKSWENIFEIAIQLFRLNLVKHFVSQLKKGGLKQLVVCSRFATNGLVFLQSFIDFLSTSYKLQSIVAELELEDLARCELLFDKHSSNASLKSLPEFSDLILIDTMKEALSAYIKPVEIQERSTDNRIVIEVIGKNTTISDILRQLEKKLSENVSIEEVRFISDDIIHIDSDLKSEIWHGRNVVILTNEIKIHGTKVWDVSGKDDDHIYESNAGTGVDGHGKQGKDGDAGESGGNVLILAEQIKNLEKWTIISNGGKGGKGQDGGNGKNGEDGQGITKSECISDFPSPVKFIDYTVRAKLKELTLSKIEELSGTSIDFNSSNIFVDTTTRRGNKIVFSYCSNILLRRCFQAYFFYGGSLGKRGGNGGEYGLAGHGGYAGEIIVKNIKNGHDFNIIKLFKQGEEGRRGNGGLYGSHGKNGNDMGYLDFQNWPEPIYCRENCKYLLKYYDNGNSSCTRVWCEQRGKYAALELVEVRNYSIAPQRNDIRTNNYPQPNAEAVRKKTISKVDILTNYSNHIRSKEKSAFQNFRSNLASIKEQTIKVISENQEQMANSLAKSKIIRTVSSQKKTKLNSNTFLLTPITTCISTTITNLEDIIKKETNNARASLDNWFQLKDIELSLSQLNQSFSLFQILTDKVNMIENLLINKHRFATLHEIAKQLPSYADIDDDELTSACAVRYLIEKQQSDENTSHPVLGTLNQYLFENSKAPRENISKFCIEEFKNEDNNQFLKSSLRVFILEVGSSEEVHSCIEQYYHSYLETSQKEDDTRLFSELDDDCCRDEDLQIKYINHLNEHGPLSETYRELLSYIFDINIRLYTEDEDCKLYLRNNHNPSADHILYILRRATAFFQLTINTDYLRLEKERAKKDCLYAKIIKKTEHLKQKQEFDDYLKNVAFNDHLEDVTLIYDEHHLNEEEDIEQIIEFLPEGEQKQLKEMLKKIAFKYTGQQGTIYNILRRFSSEGRHVSFQELSYLLNSVVISDIETRKESYTFCWLVAAYPQKDWINELILLQLENYFKKQLKEKSMLREYLSKIENKNILLLFQMKLDQCKTANSISIQNIQEILYLLSNVPTQVIILEELGLSEWCYALKGDYWSHKIRELQFQESEDFSLACYYLLCAENNFGTDIVEKFLKCIEKKKHEFSLNKFTDILSKFHNEKWNLCEADLETFYNCRNINNWIKEMEEKFTADKSERHIPQLLNLIKSNATTSKRIFDNLSEINDSIKSISEYKIAEKLVREFTEVDIKTWVTEFRNVANEKEDVRKLYNEILAVIFRAINLKRGFQLRNTQILSILTLLTNDSSTLAQVSTGEGKSLIVVAVSIMKALSREKVHIITSSVVLAKRDAEDNRDIFSVFNINVSHNCSEDIEKRKVAYSGNQVVYGDLCNFQRDYLLDRFYGNNILGDQKFANVIVDEVDSMLLDNSNNTMYLSHYLTGFDKLESLYICIWNWVNRQSENSKESLQAFHTKRVKESVLNDLYGLIKKEDIGNLSPELSEEHKNIILNRLIEAGIIDDQGKLLIANIDEHRLHEILAYEFCRYEDRLRYLLKQVIERKKHIHVPNYLRPFVELHLESWINNAICAYFMSEGCDYVVDVDRTGTVSDRNANIIILDRDTGTDLANCQWDDALHQFLQLKHGCKLSLQSLKSVFISNVSFFKLYNTLYGLSGTLGSNVERDLLKEIHGVDFVTIPTAKSKQFHEFKPIICVDEKMWIAHIYEQVKKLTRDKKRSVLIICETINDVEILHKAFGGKDAKHVHTYTRDYEEFDIAQGSNELKPGQIIIATNLAGRGTDIKITKELRKAGGLHVCLTFLPSNMRIERQAFGRAARSGDEGSGQLIIIDSGRQEMDDNTILRLKKERDSKELHRVSEIKSYYEIQITMEEKCFEKFKEQYKQLEKKLDNDKVSIEVKEILLECCLDKWALWLDENSKLIMGVRDEQTKLNVYKLFKKFIVQLENVEPKANTTWLALLGRHPFQMIKLGKYFSQNNEYNQAIEVFNDVIKHESYFSAAAHYYKAFALAKKIDWNQTPLSTEDRLAKKMFKSELRETARLLDSHIQFCTITAGIIAEIKKINNKMMIRIDAYEEQQRNLIELYSIFRQSIDDILGHLVSPQSFVFDKHGGLDIDLYEALLKRGILKNPRMKKTISIEELKDIRFSYGISVETLNDFLSQYQGKVIDSLFLKALKNELNLPSRKGFWKLLVEQKVLNEDTKFVIVDYIKLKKIDLETFEILAEKVNRKELITYRLDLDNEQIVLSAEAQAELKSTDRTFKKDNLKRTLDENKYKELKRKGVLSFNRKARIDARKVMATSLSCYDSISVEDFINKLNITKCEAEQILTELVQREVIEKKTDTENSYGLKINFDKIEHLLLPSFPIYERAVIGLLTVCFAYRIELQKIASQLENNSPIFLRLQTNPHLNMFWELLENQIIKPSTVKENDNDLTQKTVELILVSLQLANNDITEYILDTIQQSKSSLKRLQIPDSKLKHLNEICEWDDLNIGDLHVFYLNGFDHLIQFEEKRWSRIMIQRTITSFALGVTQIYIGVYFETSFFLKGVDNIVIVFADVFSFNDYMQHKVYMFNTLLSTAISTFQLTDLKVQQLFGFKLVSCLSLVGGKKNKNVNMTLRGQFRYQINANRNKIVILADETINYFIGGYLKTLSRGISCFINSKINQVVEKYMVECINLEQAHRLLREDEIIPLALSTFSKHNCMAKFLPIARNITTCILKLFKAGIKLDLTTIYNIYNIITNCSNFTDINIATRTLLVEFDQKIEDQIRKKNVVDQEEIASITYEMFKEKLSDQLKSLLVENVAQVISLHVFKPITSAATKNLITRALNKVCKYI